MKPWWVVEKQQFAGDKIAKEKWNINFHRVLDIILSIFFEPLKLWLATHLTLMLNARNAFSVQGSFDNRIWSLMTFQENSFHEFNILHKKHSNLIFYPMMYRVKTRTKICNTSTTKVSTKSPFYLIMDPNWIVVFYMQQTEFSNLSMIGCLLTLKLSSWSSSCIITGIRGGSVSVLNISSLPAFRFLNWNFH